MMFVFAYLGSLMTPPDWPVKLIYATEAAFVIVSLACIVLALKGIDTQSQRDMVATVGGISAGFGLVMPFELAPLFFHARGEIMLGTVVLILVYPFAVALFVFLFRILMKGTHRNAAR